jgi:hypothetical protein
VHILSILIRKKSFKTKNLSRTKIPDSKEKKISISEEGHSREEEAFGREQERSEGRTEKRTTLRPAATKPRFMHLLLLGPRSRPTQVYTRARWIYAHAAKISQNILIPFRTPFTSTKT